MGAEVVGDGATLVPGTEGSMPGARTQYLYPTRCQPNTYVPGPFSALIEHGRLTSPQASAVGANTWIHGVKLCNGEVVVLKDVRARGRAAREHHHRVGAVLRHSCLGLASQFYAASERR